ncbi:MAG TPA: helix-turn-helix domain-containing protein [Thermoplasmatales archaeon]|nr:helix-turn-helix domain-containing protein [Thermoplasmatales archaeon]
MMHHVTPEVRRLMVKARKNGMKVKDIVRIFGVSRKTVWKWVRRAKHPGRESFKDLPKTPHNVKRKIDVYTENAIIILRDSFNWGDSGNKMFSLESPAPYIKFLLEEVLGKVWRGRVLSRQSINEVLKKHNRNGSPYRKE